MAWNHSYGGSGGDGAAAITATVDGGCIVAGYSVSNDGDLSGNHGGNDCWVMKLDAAGAIEWSRTYGGSREDQAMAITPSTDGTGYFVAGYSTSIDGDVPGNHGGTDFLVMKLDASGRIVWNHTYGGSGDEKAAAILPIPDGGCVVAGSTNSGKNGDVSGNHGQEDYWVVNLSSAGDIVWARCYGGSWNDKATAISSSGSGYLVAGSTYSGTSTVPDGQVLGNHGSTDYWVVNLSLDGYLLKKQCYGGYYSETPTAVTRVDGGYLVAGSTSSSDWDVHGYHGQVDCWVVKIDDGLHLVWGRCYGGSWLDSATAIASAPDGGSILVGRTKSLDGDVAGRDGITHDEDYWAAKLDGDGVIQWQRSYGGSGTDAGTVVACTGDSGYLLGGNSASFDGDVAGNRGGTDCWVVKLEGPPPTIAGITPGTGLAGSVTPMSFTITGTGLSSLSGVTLSITGCYLPVTVTTSNSTSITGTLDLSAALPGLYGVNVTDRAGRTISCPDLFQVEPAVTTPITTTTTAPATLPETTRPTPLVTPCITTTVVQESTCPVPPVFCSVSPSSAQAGSTPAVTLTGENFEEGLSVYLVRDGSAPVPGSAVNITPIAVTCTFCLAGIGTGPWNMLVINADGTAFGRGDAFTVTSLQPVVVPIPPSVLVPTAPEGDGLCWDLNGNTEVDFSDVVLYFNQMDWIGRNEPLGAFDFTRDRQIDIRDIVAAFNRL